ncbi:MAG: SDR family oxidoreductase, partial [Halobacteriovoraceae bacterium]|nr:SDR family oxidoreductase [Halobacteriovoraceae bacterium]
MSTLITGISGFVGKHLLNDIKKKSDENYFLLLRDRSFDKMEKELSDFPHLIPVRGYLHHPDLLTETENWKRCKKEVQTVIHLAALYDLEAAKESLYLANVVGTQNVLFYCSQIKNLKNLVYASTIAVAGDFEGPYSEHDFDMGQSFGNSYAKTKFEAEGLVRKWAIENIKVQTDILRYGIIVGDSKKGEFQKEDGPYFFFKNVSKVMERLPKHISFPYVPFP